MEVLQLAPKHQDTVIGKILDTKSVIEYLKCDILPHSHEMADWERKEYNEIYAEKTKELEDQKDYIVAKESIFNEILCDYNLSVAVFVNKYIL